MLKKLTQAEILALKPDYDIQYYVKCWRLFQLAPVLQWEGKTALILQRNRDRLILITTEAIEWAEGGAEDVTAEGNVVVEDYQMEIFQEVTE